MSSFTKFVKRTPRSALSAMDHYRHRQQKRRLKELGQAGAVPSLDQIADPENLIQVFRELERNAGQAPGPDGVTYRALSPTEVGMCMRGLARIVQQGLYRPAPSLFVQVPKASGKGHRTLAIRGILDRMVSAALNKALTPFWDRIFLPGSMGFRPRRGPWNMLIQLERTMVQYNRWVLAIDDIKDCFDHVNIAHLMDDHRRCIQDEKLLDLIEVVLRGGERQDRREGIQQGDAYSPTAMNVRLHYAHDLGYNQGQPNPFWFRYADNTVYPCQDVPEGLQALRRSQDLLQAVGFTLKGEDGPPVDLRDGKEAQLLGFRIILREGQIGFGLGKSAWNGLKQNLERAHETPNPPVYAFNVVRGWIGAYGPTFESTRKADLERVLQTAASCGFRELATPDELWKDWQSSWERWQKRRKALCPPLTPV